MKCHLGHSTHIYNQLLSCIQIYTTWYNTPRKYVDTSSEVGLCILRNHRIDNLIWVINWSTETRYGINGNTVRVVTNYTIVTHFSLVLSQVTNWSKIIGHTILTYLNRRLRQRSIQFVIAVGCFKRTIGFFLYTFTPSLSTGLTSYELSLSVLELEPKSVLVYTKSV